MAEFVSVMASAQVGRTGLARHIVRFDVYSYPDRKSISSGQVICGARRQGSGSHSFTLDPNDANCERCRSNYYIMSQATRYPEAATILTVKHGRIIAKDES